MDSCREGSIHSQIHAIADRFPRSVAIASPGRAALTFGGLWERIEATVSMLNGTGIGRGDRVALVLPDGPEMAVAFLGVAAAATCAPLNPRFRADELDFYLSDLAPKALILQDLASPAYAVARERGIAVLTLSPQVAADAGTFVLRADDAPSPAVASMPADRLARPDDVALVLHTSGTTARAKIVPLTHANVMASAVSIGATLRLSAADRCLGVMPLFHIHGLVAALAASLVAGASVACCPGFSAPRFFDWLDELGCTWYTAVPTIHQAILALGADHGALLGRRPLRFIRSSSAPLPQTVGASLERAFGAPVIEAYGMTEAAHQIASNPLPPGSRKAGSVGRAAGPEVTIRRTGSQPLGHGERGEIMIRGANVTPGPAGRPAGEGFVDGWFATGDEGYFDEDGYLFITGRLKEMINRGGEKVAPREVDDILLLHPDVERAVAFAIPHPTLGEDVAAAIVLRRGAAVSEQDLRTFAAVRLADFKVPRRVVVVDAIPTGPTGKVTRIGLAEKLGLGPHEDGRTARPLERDRPQTPVEAALAGIWTDILGIEAVGVRDEFFEVGGDSLRAVLMFERIRLTFGVNLPMTTLVDGTTIERLAADVGRAPDPTPWPTLVPLQRRGTHPPLFFVHGLGGYVSCFASLALALGPDQPFYGLQAPGIDGLQPPLTRVEDMAARYIAEMRAVQPTGPFFLGGFSSGALIAFEMARQLAAARQSVAALWVLEPPPVASRHGRFRWCAGCVVDLAGRWGRRLDAFGRADRQARAQMIHHGLDRIGIRPWATSTRRQPRAKGESLDVSKLPHHHQAVVDAIVGAVGAYTPRPYTGGVTLVRAQTQRRQCIHDPTMGWGTLAAGGVVVHAIPGDHEGILYEPNVRTLAARVRADLAEAD